MRVNGKDPSGWGIQSQDVGFPHSSEPELDEGELWVGGYPERVEADDMGTDERCPEVCEAKGRNQTTSNNMKPEPHPPAYT